jgi:hypothetical protein
MTARREGVGLEAGEASSHVRVDADAVATETAFERINNVLLSRHLVVALVAVGAIVRIVQYAADRSLWFDESLLALNLLEKSFGGLFGTLEFGQGAAPVFLVAERLAATAFGYSEDSLRLIPLLAGLIGLVAFVPLARRLLTPVAVPIAVAFFALSEGLVYYASELKPYSLDVAVTVIILLAGVVLLDNPRSRRAATLFVVGVLLSFGFSFASVFAAASAALTLAVVTIRSRSASRPLAAALILWVVATAALIGFVATRLTAVRHAFELSSSGAVGSARSTFDLLNSFGSNLAAATGFLESSPWAQLEKVAAVVVVAGAVRLVLRQRLVGAMALLPLVLAIGAAVFRLYPVTQRTTLFLVPIVALLLAEGIAWVGTRDLRRLTVFAVITCALLAGPVSLAARGLADPRKHEEIKPVLAYVRDHWRPGDTLYLHYGAQYAFLYYERCGCLSLDGPGGRRLWPVAAEPGGGEFAPALRPLTRSLLVGPAPDAPAGRYVADLRRLRGRHRVWFLYSHVNSSDDEQTITHGVLPGLDRLGRRVDEVSRVGAHAYLYVLGG